MKGGTENDEVGYMECADIAEKAQRTAQIKFCSLIKPNARYWTRRDYPGSNSRDIYRLLGLSTVCLVALLRRPAVVKIKVTRYRSAPTAGIQG